MDDYTVLGRIGEGAHGIVMKGRHKQSGSIVALKKVLLKRLEDGIPETALREIKALQFLDSEYVVRLYDIFPQGLGFVLVFEFMVSDLSEMISCVDEPLNDAHIKSYMHMLLTGMAYLHDECSIMHRDLKPANLLISAKGQLKIADLGLSRVFSRDGSRLYSHQVATRWYRAPELLYGARKYTEAVDLWSVGCIFGELLNFAPIFPGDNDIDQLGVVIRIMGTPNDKIWPGVADLPDYSKITFKTLKDQAVPLEDIIPDASPESVRLFKAFIVYDSSKRARAADALRHEYFSEQPLPARLSEMPIPESGKKRAAAMMVGGGEKAAAPVSTGEKEYRVDRSFAEAFGELLDLRY